MDLKNTKATVLYSTESRFRQWVRVSGIAKVSPASKNISGRLNISQRRGHQAELSVIRLLQTKNWSLCFQGLKTIIAEIDLIFEKEDQVILIEVKTLNDEWRAFDRIHDRQLMNLQKNYILLSEKFKKIRFRVFVAWVDPKNRITFVEVS